MFIYIHENSKTFHLQNDKVSYIMQILPNGQAGQLYFGKRIHDREDFGSLLEGLHDPQKNHPDDGDLGIMPEQARFEYPSYGTGDYRHGAVGILQKNGSRVSRFAYAGYETMPGKPKLTGLPATYTENDDEAETLILRFEDPVTGIGLELFYTLFAADGVLARSARFTNRGTEDVCLEKAMSLCLDLPDSGYEWMQFSGAWARERHPVVRKLDTGMLSVESMRGNSSHQNNPFMILKRPDTNEDTGEAIGFSLVYSGNFLISAEVDAGGMTRVLAGINPAWFSWQLKTGDTFQTPEAIAAYSDEGLNGMSQSLHRLYRKRLARGEWRDRPRPILLNNWEATYFDFNEEKLLRIAKRAKECGVELFVLDDGWFGKRRNDRAGLGDWIPCRDLLPGGITGLAEKVTGMGLQFGLWIEPEMVNPDSDLYRAHPDWCLHVPGRPSLLSRNQLVLDFSRHEVVEYIYGMISAVLKDARISYIKWDMNRSLTECFSAAAGPERQGEIFHRHILGVYALYERLTNEFPHILFESCAGGGGRFDPGMLYYAPQAWTSDNTDAVERVRIQYGTSYGYPLSGMGSHVSAVPGHQMNRTTPLKTRAETAYFGTYGYELDLNTLSAKEREEVRQYTAFMKAHRELIQFGTFYRLRSPFAHNDAAWMVVSEDRREALVGYYRTLSRINERPARLFLRGLETDMLYEVEGVGSYYGDELMNAGLAAGTSFAGDFCSELFLLKAAGQAAMRDDSDDPVTE